MNSTLHIQNQPRLPWSQQAELLLDGMRHRFFRTLLTWTVVALAVAFVCFVLAEQQMVDAADAHATAELERFIPLQRFAAWFDGPVDARTLQDRIAQIPEHSWELAALQGMLGIHGPAADAFVNDARTWTRSRQWFESLSLANRRIIFNSTRWPEVIVMISDARQFPTIKEAAYQVSARMPQGLEQAAASRKEYVDQLQAHVMSLQKQRQVAAARIQRQSMLPWLASAKTSELQVQTLFDELGITLSNAQVTQVIAQAREYQDVLAHARSGASGTTDVEPASKAAFHDSPSTARHIVQLQEQADAMRQKILASYPGREQKNRTPWLVGTAFLVCLAGISNAMLVSVLERFREIATMKCLGAMDSFIAVIFLAEASLIGLIGGLAGGLVGVLTAIVRVSWTLGAQAIHTTSPLTLALIVGSGVCCGWLLAMLSSIYPAVAAARMPPMEAMRMD